ncbi:MAG: terpene cyclase/mutase family protein [Candidatus Aminicenantes bacterium]|nr:terpene cyclase/mutase family protein [Candidatus Aminicenantes bacterium]
MNDLLPTLMSLRNMMAEMNRKNLDLKRITKTASLLLLSGLSRNSIPHQIVDRCLNEQHPDGGWVSTVDTMWNAFFLKLVDEIGSRAAVQKALGFISFQENKHGLWGRSQRDISRIPVTGILFYLFPELANEEKLSLLEELWKSEKNSLTYKASYTLMAFGTAGYNPKDKNLIDDTLEWLRENQRNDGGFAPWKNHPAAPDVFCTSIALLGLLQYKESIPTEVFQKSYRWIMDNRLPEGIWPFHEIEDGASWALYALSQLLKYNMVTA